MAATLLIAEKQTIAIFLGFIVFISFSMCKGRIFFLNVPRFFLLNNQQFFNSAIAVFFFITNLFFHGVVKPCFDEFELLFFI